MSQIKNEAVDAALAALYAETEIGYMPSGIMRVILGAAAPYIERAALVKAGVIASSRDHRPTQ